ncbi:MAG: hypothetical protein ACOZIN_12160 [Myxococcota bacterium]
MIRHPARGFLLWALLVAGCATKRVAPPPEQTLALGGHQAVWRDWSKGEPCDADPLRLGAELDAMNALLAELLGATSAGMNGMWADEHLALLEQGQQALPAPLAALDAMLPKLPGCELTPPLGDRLTRAEELTRQAKGRLAEAPELLAFVRARRELENWKRAQPSLQDAGREQRCRGKSTADVFYASEDEKGRTQWLFCDDSKVLAEPGSLPVFVAPPNGRRPKKKPPTYLQTAARHPSDAVQRAPKLPVKKLPPREEDVLAEPKDL